MGLGHFSPDIPLGPFPTEKNAINIVEIEVGIIKQYFSGIEAGLMKQFVVN